MNDGSAYSHWWYKRTWVPGVNVQKRIVMHHVDVPWTPAEEQREGRGVRQVTMRDFNDDNVDVYFYATE